MSLILLNGLVYKIPTKKDENKVKSLLGNLKAFEQTVKSDADVEQLTKLELGIDKTLEKMKAKWHYLGGVDFYFQL